VTVTKARIGFRVSDDYIAGHPDADPSATELVINLFLTAELLRGRMERLLQPFGIGGNGHNLLQIVSGAGQPVTPSEIGEQLIVTTATVTGLVDTLERRGFVTRTRDEVDRRKVLVAITREGRDVLRRIEPVLIEHEKQWSAGVEGVARERLIRGLGALQHHLGQLPPE
jgi:DNA-binding MarR family transcriptional regulator